MSTIFRSIQDALKPGVRVKRPSRQARERSIAASRHRRRLEFESMEGRVLLAGIDPATPFNFFIFGPMNEQNTDVEGRLAVGGPAVLTNFGVARPPGSEYALVSGTSLTYTNGTIQGDLHYNDNAATLTNVAVTGTTFPNSTPIDFNDARTTLTNEANFLSTLPATGTATLDGSTLTLTGNPANSLNVFSITTAQLAATNNGRVDLTNVSPTSTILINVSGTTLNIQNTDFQFNGVGGDQPIASRILYNFPQLTSLSIQSASPLGSVLAPLAAVTSQNGAHISGTLVAESLEGTLEGHDFPFEGDLPTEDPGSADLVITKSASTTSPLLNGTITFTITVSNLGPDTSRDVVVSDPLPAGITFVSVDPSQGSYDPTTGLWNVGDVLFGEPATLTLVGTITTCDPVINTANISSTQTPDPDSENNTSSVTVTPLQTDLAVTKIVNNATPVAGAAVTFTIMVTNNGPLAAQGVALADQLPEGLTLVSTTASQGAYDAATGRWTVGALGVGASATLQLVVTAAAPGRYVNGVVIAASDLPDCDPANNGAQSAIDVQPGGGVPPTLDDVDRFGVHHQRTTLVLTFSVPLDPARAQNRNNYRLNLLIHGRVPGPNIPVTAAVYDPAENTVTLSFSYPLKLRSHYRLIVNGTAPDGLATPSGVLLDGLSNGAPGSNAVRVVTARSFAGPNPFPRFTRMASRRLGTMALPRGLATAHLGKGR